VQSRETEARAAWQSQLDQRLDLPPSGPLIGVAERPTLLVEKISTLQ
jgi:hypothetical protein